MWCLTQEYSSPPSPGTLADITMQELGNHHHHCFHNHHDERPTFIIIITIIIIAKSFQGQLGCMSWGDPRLSPSSFHPSGNGLQTKKLDEKRLDKTKDMPRKKRKQVRKRKKSVQIKKKNRLDREKERVEKVYFASCSKHFPGLNAHCIIFSQIYISSRFERPRPAG